MFWRLVYILCTVLCRPFQYKFRPIIYLVLVLLGWYGVRRYHSTSVCYYWFGITIFSVFLENRISFICPIKLLNWIIIYFYLVNITRELSLFWNLILVLNLVDWMISSLSNVKYSLRQFWLVLIVMSYLLFHFSLGDNVYLILHYSSLLCTLFIITFF